MWIEKHSLHGFLRRDNHEQACRILAALSGAEFDARDYDSWEARIAHAMSSR